MSKHTYMSEPIPKGELKQMIAQDKAASLRDRIAGLREAAEILSGYLKAGNTAGLQTGLLQDSLDDILARIAELENLRHE